MNIDINGKDSDGYSALMWAVANQKIDVVKYLLDQGADVNQKDDNDYVALSCACSYDNKEMVLLLFEYGADAMIRDDDGHYPSHYTSSRKIKEIMKQHETDVDET